jgi:hypothetical protein
MAELDQNAWVLEPEAPNLADLHRRIVVAKHAYLDITIKYAKVQSPRFLQMFFCSDAAHPRAAPPTLALVGAEATCAPLRLQIRNYRWSSDKSLLENILVALSLVTLPSPPRPSPSAVEEEGLVALECGICYAYRMQVLPSAFHPTLAQKFILSSASCSQPFQIKRVPMSSVQKRASPSQIFTSKRAVSGA